MKMIYFAYQYSDGPKKRADEIKHLVQELIKKRKDIIPFIPHWAIDAWMDFPEGYDGNQFVLIWELEILARCDGICLPPPMTPALKKCGVIWEEAIAKWLKLPVYEYWDLMELAE